MTEDKVQLKVAPRAEVRRDLWGNVPWLLALLLVSLAYVLTISGVIRVWETDWSFLHAAYFTIINMTTVGFGDVTPATHVGKVIAGINGLVGLVLFGLFVAVIALALQPAEWSADLPQLQETSPARSPAELRSDNREDEVVRGTAEVLEGLAKVLRAGGNVSEDEGGSGRVRIYVYSESADSAAVADVWIHIRAG